MTTRPRSRTPTNVGSSISRGVGSVPHSSEIFQHRGEPSFDPAPRINQSRESLVGTGDSFTSYALHPHTVTISPESSDWEDGQHRGIRQNNNDHGQHICNPRARASEHSHHQHTDRNQGHHNGSSHRGQTSTNERPKDDRYNYRHQDEHPHRQQDQPNYRSQDEYPHGQQDQTRYGRHHEDSNRPQHYS